ncbi:MULTISPECIES: hypothetical protein [unclassified Streptomyces]|uniref:hypothetical protein n=1 Tax=unclassified Streptomyces TaxID=2593676 RepID=UPI0014882F6D|nr:MULTISPECIES: hypothetical protein [unclassified Streptomyces]
MFVYRNSNTGDVVRYEYRSARLDMLPNWELVEQPAPEPEETTGGGGGDGSGPGVGERPARSAPKADWVAYARTRAQDSDEEAAIDGLTKEQLIEQYGSES